MLRHRMHPRQVMTRELGVWLHANQVGTLTLEADRLGFAYDVHWLTQSASVALSCSLPLREQPFDDRECRPFFSGLLPEGQLRQLIAQQCQVSGGNDFALLAAIGGECAGAITFLPVGSKPQTVKPEDTEWLDDSQLRNLLDELPHRPMLAGRDGLRLSLAGAQDKLPVVFDGSRIGLPKGGRPSTHILKPAIRSLEGSVINEAFCLALAGAMQLPAAQAIVHDIGERRVLLVTRYDRRVADEAGLSKAQTRRRVSRFAETLPMVAQELLSDGRFARQPLLEKIVKLVEERSALAVLRLSA